MLKPEIMNAMNLRSYNIEKQFKSKKNKVYLARAVQLDGMDTMFVLKQYDCVKTCRKEEELLSVLNNSVCRVPQLLCTGDDFLILQYISGTTLCEYFIASEEKELQPEEMIPTIHLLAVWLTEFYKAIGGIAGKQTVLGDVNLRNFLLSEGIYGIDFEDCRDGSIEEDIGKMCAFLLTYSPAFTSWKIAVAKHMLEILTTELSLSVEAAEAEKNKELVAIKRRRNCSEKPRVGPIDYFQRTMDNCRGHQ